MLNQEEKVGLEKVSNSSTIILLFIQAVCFVFGFGIFFNAALHPYQGFDGLGMGIFAIFFIIVFPIIGMAGFPLSREKEKKMKEINQQIPKSLKFFKRLSFLICCLGLAICVSFVLFFLIAIFDHNATFSTFIFLPFMFFVLFAYLGFKRFN